MLTCIKCGVEREKGSRYCRDCYLEKKREQAQERYKKNGRYNYGTTCCVICGESKILLNNKSLSVCSDCYIKTNIFDNEEHPYTYVYDVNTKKATWEHVLVAEDIICKKLNKNEVSHHIDGNPHNNSITNIMIISRSNHAKLHMYMKRVYFETLKHNKDNPENTIDFDFVKNTYEWLEKNNVEYIDIGKIK